MAKMPNDGYRPPISVLIFRNNDEFFPGLPVKVTRGMFKTWVTFFDHLTQHLQLRSGAVHRYKSDLALFDMFVKLKSKFSDETS